MRKLSSQKKGSLMAFVAVMFDAVNWDGSKHAGGDEDLIVGEEKQKPHSHP